MALEAGCGASSSACTPASMLHTTLKSSKTPYCDRFIPYCVVFDLVLCPHAIYGKGNDGLFRKDEHLFQTQLADILPGRTPASLSANDIHVPDMIRSEILSFAEKHLAVNEGYVNPSRVLSSQSSFGAGVCRNKFQHIFQSVKRF